VQREERSDALDGYPRHAQGFCAPSPRRAHDIAFTLVQALHSPAASPQFLGAGEAYYRRLYEGNPKIRADWREWNPAVRQR
jgi:hypothetical protein